MYIIYNPYITIPFIYVYIQYKEKRIEALNDKDKQIDILKTDICRGVCSIHLWRCFGYLFL